jgi:hypothetical protein
MGAETDGGEQTRGLRSVRGRAAVPVTGYTGELKVFFFAKKRGIPTQIGVQYTISLFDCRERERESQQ